MKIIYILMFVFLSNFKSFAQTDLEVKFINYENSEFVREDTLQLNFEVINYGPQNLVIGDTLYFSSKLNNQIMGLDLLGTETPVVLTQDLNVGQSFVFNPGYLIGSQTLMFFPGFDTLETCVIVWGKGLSSVSSNLTFPNDLNSSNNISCATYNPNAKDDLGLNLINYNNGQITNNDTLKYDFYVKNFGRTTFKSGDSIYFSVRLNNQFFALNLLGTETSFLLNSKLGLEDTFQVQAGYLIGSQTLAFFPGATTLESCLYVWGKGLNSIDFTPSFPSDFNSINNTSCFTFDPNYASLNNSMSKSIEFYPNPANQTIHLNFNNNEIDQIKIMDLSGKLLKNISIFNNEIDLDLMDLPNGLYQFSLYNKQKTINVIKVAVNH